MVRIIDKRGNGKTSRLMLLAKENDGLFICVDPEYAKRKALGYGLIGFDIISFQEYFTNIGNYLNRDIYIDDLEALLSIMGNIKGYTLTEEY